jgi:uncharacterized peroxidase-related enzyme
MHHHGGSLRRLTNDAALVDAALKNPERAELTPRWRALADFAIRLTRRPAEVHETDVAALRRNGLSDAGVHDAVAVTAYFNFVNRLAEGVHIPIEPPD